MPWFIGKDCLICARPEGSEYASFSDDRTVTLDSGKVVHICNRCAEILDERYDDKAPVAQRI